MPQRILIIRLSAIGDVAILLPILHAVARAYPQTEFVMLTQCGLVSLFEEAPANLKVIGLDIRDEQRSFWGLISYLRTAELGRFSHIIDCHDVLRSKIIRFMLRSKCRKVLVLNKERHARKALLTEGPHSPVTPVNKQYSYLFEQAGFALPTEITPPLRHLPLGENTLFPELSKEDQQWIGIAPFAKHIGKIYPMEQMLQLIGSLIDRPSLRVFLFGGGEQERKMMEHWQSIHPKLMLIPKNVKLLDEVHFMQHLDMMLTMDSANMHFAALVGTPTLSIWGQTHPSAGFLPWSHPIKNVLQEELACRPCSIFGNKPCSRGDWACLRKLSSKRILARIDEILAKPSREM